MCTNAPNQELGGGPRLVCCFAGSEGGACLLCLDLSCLERCTTRRGQAQDPPAYRPPPTSVIRNNLVELWRCRSRSGSGPPMHARLLQTLQLFAPLLASTANDKSLQVSAERERDRPRSGVTDGFGAAMCHRSCQRSIAVHCSVENANRACTNSYRPVAKSRQ
jgi:hypothetical protein